MKKLQTIIGSSRLTDFLLLILILCAAFGIESLSFYKYEPRVYSDSAIYATLARKFIEGDWFNAFHVWWQPLYPFLASLIYPFTQSIEKSLFYVSVIFGVLLFIPIYFIALEILKSRTLAVFAGLFSIFSKQLMLSYFNLLTENLYIFLLYSSFCFALLTFTRKKLRYSVVYGLITGVTYYARNDVLLFVQIFILFGLILAFLKKINWGFFIKIIFSVVVCFLVIILPYIYLSSLKFGYVNLSAKFNAVKNMPAYFSPQQNYTTTFAQDVWSIDTPNYDSDFFNKPYSYFKNREELWDGAIKRFWGYLKEFRQREDSLSIFLIVISFFVSLGYFIRNKFEALYLHVLLVLGFLLSLPFQPGVDYRYEIWIYPILAIFLMVCLLIILNFINQVVKKSGFRKMIEGILLIGVILISFFAYKNNFQIPTGDIAAAREVDALRTQGEFIRSLGKENPRIMTRREAITFYARGSIVYIPTSIGISELKDYAKLWKVDYLDADKYTFAPETPLGFLVDEKQAPGWLVPVKIWDKEFTKTVIYKVDLAE